MTNDKDVNRLYNPVKDGLVFTPGTWQLVIDTFNGEIVNRRKKKFDREVWRVLTKANYQYRILYFYLDSLNYCSPLFACIVDYHTNGTTTSYGSMPCEDGSLGEFLANAFFYDKFQLVEVDTCLSTFGCTASSTVIEDILERWKKENEEPVDTKLYTTSSIADNFTTINENAVTGGSAKSSDSTVEYWAKYFSNAPTKLTTDTADWKYDTITTTGTPITVNTYDATRGCVNVDLDNEVKDNLKKISDRLDKLENKKEDKKMKMFNFDFGPIKDNDAIRMSPYGIAVKNVNGTYQAYDKVNGEMMDVDVFNFKADNMFFKMPVAVDAVAVGDVIIFNRKPCFVFGFSEQGDVIVIDIALGEKKTILPNKSPFNFNYITKVVSLMDNMFGGSTPSAENPFGNILPFMMMSDDSSMKDMLPMMMFMNSGGATNTNSNLMLYLMMQDGNKDMDKWMPLLFMNMAK